MVRTFSGPPPGIVLHRPTVTNVVASRALNTTYQNTTGRPIMCIVTVVCTKNAAADQAIAEGRSEAATPPTIINTAGGLDNLAGTALQQAYFPLVWVVPSNYYYSCVAQLIGGGACALVYWIEVTL